MKDQKAPQSPNVPNRIAGFKNAHNPMQDQYGKPSHTFVVTPQK
jgi:hypothetical protein